MISRRNFLLGLGATGAAATLSGLKLGLALAGDELSGAPKRLIVLSTCHGWPYDSWKMRPGSLSDSGTWEVDLAGMSESEFSQPLAPLYAHRQRLLALDGVSLGTAELDLDGYRHQKGWIQAWTGNYAYFNGSELGAQSQSLDQLVAAQIARVDRLPSLELAISAGGVELPRPINHAGFGLPLPMEDSPSRLWQRLFGPSVSPDPLAQRQRGVLDYAKAEYSALAPRLGTRDREKLELHFELVERLSQRLDGMANLSCENIPAVLDDLRDYDHRFDTFAELTAMAFSCDITRVATFSMGEMPTADFGWDHVTDDTHKGLAHEIYNDAEAHQAMTDYSTVHATQVARLVSLLESIPDSDGNSVMDNTLIVWGSELANGWHGYLNYCPVLIGGSWHFETGRYLHWPHETPIELLVASGYTSMCGKPHQQLLVSVAQAMGLDVNHVGIKHVQSQAGVRIDCTGPLPGLTRGI